MHAHTRAQSIRLGFPYIFIYMSQANIKEIIKQEYVKCATDPVHFFRKYCYITHPIKGRILFHLYPFQEQTLNDFRNNRFCIINKSRQLGISTLVAGKWNFASYNDYIYAINPGAVKTVYKHLIGETTGVNAWVNVQDSSYVNTTGGITNIITTQPSLRPWNASDTFTVTASTFLTSPFTFATPVSGTIPVSASASNNTGDQGGIRIQCTFSANVDVSRNDYIAIRVKLPTTGGAFYNFQNFYGVPNADKPVLRFNGVDQNPEYRLYVNEDGSELVIFMFTKGFADRDKLQRVTFSAIASVNQSNSTIPVLVIQPFEQGGVYLNATTSGKRIWDSFDIKPTE